MKFVDERAQERTKLIPAMREVFTFDHELGQLVYAKDIPPRCKAGKVAGSLNGHSTRQVMFNGVRYVAHEIVYALHNDVWPATPVKFRDGNILNLQPENLYLED